MSNDDKRQMIPADRAASSNETPDRARRTAEIRRRQPLPNLPVTPQFAEDFDDEPGRLNEYFSKGCLLPALVLAAIVLALVALSLFLPPVSLWDEIEKQLEDDESPSETGPTTFVSGGLTFANVSTDPNEMTVFGLTLGVSPDDVQGSYGVHVEALTPADYLAGNVPAAGWHCLPDLPEGYALASRVYSLTQSGASPEKVRLELTALPDNASPGELTLHVWHAAREEWVFMPSAPAENPLAVTSDLAVLPRCAALFRQSDMTRFVGVMLDVTDSFAPEIMAANMRLYTGSIRPTITGALNVLLAPGFETGQGYDVIPLVQNYDDSGVIDVATVEQILSYPGLRTEHARQIAAFVLAQDNYAGAAIDYRAIPLEQRDSYTAFLRELADLLHDGERKLTVILPAPTQDGDTWSTGAYDWVAAGQIADRVVICAPLNPRAYMPSGQIDDLLVWATTQITRSKLLLGINAFSIEDFDGLSFAPITLPDTLAYLGNIHLDTGTTVPPDQTITARLEHPAGLQAAFGGGDTGRSISYTIPDGETLRTMWITDAAAVNLRLERAAAHGLGGVFVWHLMTPGVMPHLAGSVIAYKLEQPAPPAPQYDPVEWRVYEGDMVVAKGAGQLDEAFSFQPAGEGVFRFAAHFASGDLIDSIEVIVSAQAVPPTPAPVDPTQEPTLEPTQEPTIESTLEPTGEPTLTPTIEPTQEPTLEPTSEPTQEPTAEPTDDADVQPLPTLPSEPSGASDAVPTETLAISPTLTPAVLQAPTIASSTPEVTAAAPEIVEYPTATPPPGVTPLDLSLPVPVVDPSILAQTTLGTTFEAGAHISGVTSSILQVGRMGLTWVKIDVRYQLGQSPIFFEQGIAEAQANGFRVLLNVTGDPFEFMGTDRALYLGGYVQFVGELAALGADGIEVWNGMNGRMTPDEYVQMLAYAYHAIKTTNPDTMVITGALRPVAQTDNLDEDDSTYYIRLGEANVAQYADCIGVTYTLGTVSPTSVSGDPRGDSPVYYLPRMTDRAVRAAQRADGSALPLCFTRFGYLTPEGYAALPEDFAWAQATTAAQQAQWLAEAIQLSQQGTQVRLLIIWSLDAAYFGGGSPEEGYAIIRPDGLCPACETIAPLFEEE